MVDKQKIIKINQYDHFRCIADACSLSCCQEWKIGVDEETHLKWEGKHLQSQMKLHEQVVCDEGGYHVKLGKDKRCPFLNETNLCQLVLDKGENFLSNTCATFPRQINSFKDRIEYSLDTGCPAVIDLFNNCHSMIEWDKQVDSQSNNLEHTLLYQARDAVIALVQNEKYTLEQALMVGFYILLELYDEEITSEAIEALTQEDQITEVLNVIKKMRFNSVDTFLESNELFLDVIDNYRKEGLYIKYIESMGVYGEQLEKLHTDKVIKEKANAFKDMFKYYEPLMKKYVIAEIIGTCLKPEMNLEEMVISFEWIIISFATLRQALFIKWLSEEQQTLSYETVRDYMSVIARITGYPLNDVREYLENSFEHFIVEWGYIALIVGM